MPSDTALYDDAIAAEAFGYEAPGFVRRRDPVFTRLSLGLPEPQPGAAMAAIEAAVARMPPFPTFFPTAEVIEFPVTEADELAGSGAHRI